jgi:hypothetical protein
MISRFAKTCILSGVALGAASFAMPRAANAAILADWTFETSIPATAGPFAPEVGSGAALGSHAGAAVYSSPAGNGSAHSFSSNTWAVGDYWQFSTSTTGFQNITIQWDQTSSSTGPRDFELDYSTDGTTFTPLFGSPTPYQVLPNAAPNPVWNSTTSSPIYTFGPIAGPAALDNQANVFFRLIDKSTVSANGGTVAATGTDRIDNVIISGTEIPEPASLRLLAGAGALAARRRRSRA